MQKYKKIISQFFRFCYNKKMENTNITTERLELKPIKLEDAEELFKITSNKTTTRYMLYAGTENIQETIDFIADCQKD